MYTIPKLSVKQHVQVNNRIHKTQSGTYHHDSWVGGNKSIHTPSREMETRNTGKITLHMQLLNDIYKLSERNYSDYQSASFDYLNSW